MDPNDKTTTHNDKDAESHGARLSDDEIAAEEEFLKGLPPINIGAFFMPGIWGPAHGFWACLLFYPLYLFADNLFYSAYVTAEAWIIALAVLAGIILVVIHLAFARVSGPLSAHRSENRGISRETYLRRERIWAVVCVILAIAAIAWATYYNLNIRM